MNTTNAIVDNSSREEKRPVEHQHCFCNEWRERMAQHAIQPRREKNRAKTTWICNGKPRLRFHSLLHCCWCIVLAAVFTFTVDNLIPPGTLATEVEVDTNTKTVWPVRTKYAYEGPDGCNSNTGCYCTKESRLVDDTVEVDTNGDQIEDGLGSPTGVYTLETLKCTNVSDAPGSYLIMRLPPFLVNLYLKWDSILTEARQEFRTKFTDKIVNNLSKAYQWTSTAVRKLWLKTKDSSSYLLHTLSGEPLEVAKGDEEHTCHHELPPFLNYNLPTSSTTSSTTGFIEEAELEEPEPYDASKMTLEEEAEA